MLKKSLKVKKQNNLVLLSLILSFALLLGNACASQQTQKYDSNQNNASASKHNNHFAKTHNQEPIVEIPYQAFKGEPFLIKASVPGLKKAEVSWAGKHLEYVPSNLEGEPEVRFILAAGLQEKKHVMPLTLTLYTDSGKKLITRDLDLMTKQYPVQRLSVAPKYVTPPASVQKKIQEDRVEMRRALSTLSSERNWTLPFIRPVPGVVTSEYGLRREFNGQKRNPHRGLDLDGRLGDPILAAEKGTVVLASDHYYGGNTIVIDHGLGVFTIYLHMNSFAVSTGQKVERGETIGTVGKTGRVTGPHLHLSLSILGESVNPSPVLEPYPGT